MESDERCPALGDLGVGSVAQHSFGPLGLLGRLGDFAGGGGLLLHTLNHADRHSLPHVAHRETTCKAKRRWDLLGLTVALQSLRWCAGESIKNSFHLNLPSGGYSEKLSTHMGLPGTISTMAASPDLRDLGLSSSFLPDRRSIFSLSSANLQAMWAV